MEEKSLYPQPENGTREQASTQADQSRPVFAPTGNVEVIEYQQVGNQTIPPSQLGDVTQNNSTKPPNKFVTFIKKYPLVLPAAIVVLLSIIGAVIWVFVSQVATADYKDVTVQIEAPKEIPVGSTREWKVTVTNNNPVSVYSTSVKLEFDQNFKYGANLTRDINYDPKSTTYFLNTIDAKQTRVFSFEGQALGAIQETTTMYVKVSFAPHSTQTIKTHTIESQKYVTTIIASDIKAELTKQQELVEVNTDTSMSFQFENVSDKDIPNLRIQATYPNESDFLYRNSQIDQGSFADSKNMTSEGVNVWMIKVLPKKSVFRITVQGKIQPNAKTELPFTFGIYSLSADKDWRKIIEKTDTIRSTPQSLAITTYINGVKELFKPAQKLEVVVEYENKSTKSISGIEITSTINDPAGVLDYSKLDILTGTPSVSNKTVIWKAGSFAELATLQPGVKGALRYMIPVKTLELAINSSLSQNQYTLQPIAEVKQAERQSIIASSAVQYKMIGGVNFWVKATEIQDKSQTVFATDSGDFKIVRVSFEIATFQNALKDVVIESTSPLTSLSTSQPVYNPLSISPANFGDKLLFNDKGGAAPLSIRMGLDTLENYIGIKDSKFIVVFDLKIPAALTPNPSVPVYNAVTVLNKTTFTAVDQVTGETYKFEAPAFTFGKLPTTPNQ